MVNNKELEFYNSTLKDLIESNKTFHFEVQKGYFNKQKSKKFLNSLEDFCYKDDGYYETLQLKINSSNILTLSMKTDSGKPKHGKQYGYNFLMKFNDKRNLKFPYYYWNLLFEFAEIKDGEFKNDLYYVEV